MKQLLTFLFITYCYLMFIGIGILLFMINGLHYNPIGINEDFGAQFLLGYLMFMCSIVVGVLLQTHVMNSTYENNRVYYTREECVQEYGKVFGPIYYNEQFPLFWSVNGDEKNSGGY